MLYIQQVVLARYREIDCYSGTYSTCTEQIGIDNKIACLTNIEYNKEVFVG